MEWNRKDPPDISSHENAPFGSPKISGFLTIVAIGLIISFLQNLAGLGQSLVPFRGEVWERLTTPGFSAYHPYWKPAILFGIISSSVILALSAISLVLFFRKHRFFPTFIVVAIPVIFVLMLAGYYLEGLVPAVAASPAYANTIVFLQLVLGRTSLMLRERGSTDYLMDGSLTPPNLFGWYWP